MVKMCLMPSIVGKLMIFVILDLAHHLWGLTLRGRLLICPAASEKVHRVLDVGTGTGIWAIDFGTVHCLLCENLD
jgi:methylase of polypeptide subunit release factors